MEITKGEMEGVFLVRFEPSHDDRGSFVRGFAAEVWEAHGLDATVVHTNISINTAKGTVRGLHYQAPPHSETKTVHCVKGVVWDVVVDIRPESSTYLKWQAFELELGSVLYIPIGMAHGFQTLVDDCILVYHMGAGHEPGAARGIRWNDPSVGISWPLEVAAISDRDAVLPLVGAGWTPVESGPGDIERG